MNKGLQVSEYRGFYIQDNSLQPESEACDNKNNILWLWNHISFKKINHNKSSNGLHFCYCIIILGFRAVWSNHHMFLLSIIDLKIFFQISFKQHKLFLLQITRLLFYKCYCHITFPKMWCQRRSEVIGHICFCQLNVKETSSNVLLFL